MNQKECMQVLKSAFHNYIGCNRSILDAYSYSDNRASDIIASFKRVVENKGFKLSNCYHASGIGNNNEYTIFLEDRDADGFIIKKTIAEFYYCYGIYGGCYVSLKDLATNEKITIGRAR